MELAPNPRYSAGS